MLGACGATFPPTEPEAADRRYASFPCLRGSRVDVPRCRTAPANRRREDPHRRDHRAHGSAPTAPGDQRLSRRAGRWPIPMERRALRVETSRELQGVETPPQPPRCGGAFEDARVPEDSRSCPIPTIRRDHHQPRERTERAPDESSASCVVSTATPSTERRGHPRQRLGQRAKPGSFHRRDAGAERGACSKELRRLGRVELGGVARAGRFEPLSRSATATSNSRAFRCGRPM